ncbi:ER membrane protein complex subunit 1 isoform X2 [Planococcus citri]|uniref:ER membrane protein complex subunit 1 isoform X2 n=1 Tax=Planococcus citri TaxID=170843 RepID=UPI0031F86C8E
MTTKVFLTLFAVILLHNGCFALYEDQIGKFDWKKDLVGEVKFSRFDNGINFHETVYVATEHNTVAALTLKTGEIKWRNVLEKGSRGVINLLHHVNNAVFAVSGSDVVIVRIWNAKQGALMHQWSLLQDESEEPQQILWFAHEILLYRVVVKSNNVEISTFKIFNGEKTLDRNVKAPVSAKDKCSVSKWTMLCLNENGETVLINLTQAGGIDVETNSNIVIPGLERILDIRASPYERKPSYIVTTADRKFLFANLNQSNFELVDTVPIDGDIWVDLLDLGVSVLEITVLPISETELEINGYFLNPKRTSFSHRYSLKHPVASITISSVDCYKQSSGALSCVILLSTSDGSVVYLSTPGKIEWVRDEGLSSIITAEFIELPMSDNEAEMQTEFETKESELFNMLTRRISSHIFQFQKFVLNLSGILEKSFSVEKENKLVRDYFNLHKIILIITKHMKIYALDNINQEVHWSHLLNKKYEPFPASSEDFEVRIPLYIQRTYRHYPHPMQCTILVKQRGSQNGVIISFNPVTGKFDSPIELDYKIRQGMLIPKTTVEDHLQGLILTDEKDGVHVYPERTLPIFREIASSLHIYVANAETCDINGYTFSSDASMTLIPVWNVKCRGKIVKISGKNPIEKVHSQGRVLGDRSVLYKYINPNLIAVVSKDINPEDQKTMLTLYFVDSVTGVLVNGSSHVNGGIRHRGTDPVHLVHSENWVVLMYFNHKTRRTEVSTYELYEGKTQLNSTAFSSVQSKDLHPIIDTRSYILPTSFIEAARETITEKGITSKHVLVALSTGNVVELPWVILDPRRPTVSTPEMKEEGIIPYMPEIPIPTETMINYNRTLHRTRGIVTSPSGLESTSLVFVYGLDLFYTRTAPSKTFDLLKEDFDYMLIIIVLVLLIASTFITKHFAYKRALKQAWR